MGGLTTASPRPMEVHVLFDAAPIAGMTARSADARMTTTQGPRQQPRSRIMVRESGLKLFGCRTTIEPNADEHPCPSLGIRATRSPLS
jgi:hypothetical protein